MAILDYRMNWNLRSFRGKTRKENGGIKGESEMERVAITQSFHYTFFSGIFQWKIKGNPAKPVGHS